MARNPFRRKPASVPPSEVTEQYEDGHGLRMGLFDHLDELRRRLTRAFIVVVIGTVIGFVFAGELLDYLRQPYCQIVDQVGECELVVLGPTGNIVAYMRIALLIGGIIGIPMITYQVLMFIVPGLTRRERRYVLGSLPAVTGLFLVGVAFAWFILTPTALDFLESFQEAQFEAEWTADEYLGFVTALLFWMGVAFQTPLIFFMLSLLGLVRARTLLNSWRIAIVGSAVAAAFITPTIDPVNMALVMVPLLALYLLSIVLVVIGRRMAGLNRTEVTS